MRGARLELLHAADFFVHAFERRGEDLFTLQGMLGCAGEASSSRLSFAARFAALLARQGPLPLTHVAETVAQCFQVIERDVVDPGMVTPQDHLVLVVAENAALEFAGNRHGNLQVFRRRTRPSLPKSH